MKILYLEDNAINLSLIERIAKMNKHELIAFEEAEAALAVLEKGEKVDLILLDIQLAGEMDGIAFAKTIRQKGWQQPIIAITAYAMMGDKERIIAAGCNEYLPKPLPISEFLTLLAKYDTAATSKATNGSPAEAKPSDTPPSAPPTVEAKPQTAAVTDAQTETALRNEGQRQAEEDTKPEITAALTEKSQPEGAPTEQKTDASAAASTPQA